MWLRARMYPLRTFLQRQYIAWVSDLNDLDQSKRSWQSYVDHPGQPTQIFAPALNSCCLSLLDPRFFFHFSCIVITYISSHRRPSFIIQSIALSPFVLHIPTTLIFKKSFRC